MNHTEESRMQTYRCTCGQPLAGFAVGLPGLGLAVPAEAIARQVDTALERHRARSSTGHHDLAAQPGSGTRWERAPWMGDAA